MVWDRGPVIGENSADNEFDSSLVVANKIGSLIERNQWVIEALGGAAIQVRSEKSTSATVEENAIQQFSIAIYDVDSGAVASGDIDITGISNILMRSRAGGAFSATGITQPTFAKGTGLVSCDYQFLAAEWQQGDMYKLNVKGITATIGGDTAYIPEMVWSNIVVEMEDVTAEIAKIPKSDSTVSWNATALQAIQDEAEDALEGEDLDHLLMLDGASQKYPVNCAANSIIAKMIAKGDPATPSTYDCTTDSLEMLSDKTGAFTGDGGADQDDSVKASLDLAHTDLDAIIASGVAADGLVFYGDVTTANSTSNFKVARLAGKGTNVFNDVYYCQVVEADNAAPEGEVQKVSAYTTGDGDITVGTAFTAAPEVGDQILIIHESLVLSFLHADATLSRVADDSIIAHILAVDGDVSDYNDNTMSLEALNIDTDATIAELAKVPKSDAAVTWNATALQSMQDEAEDALEGENLDHLQAVTTVAADMTAEVVDGSVISRMLSKTSDTSSYDPTTDAQEMLSDKLGAFTGDGGADQDDSTKASLDLAHTDLDAIIVGTITNAAGADVATDVVAAQASLDAIIANQAGEETVSSYNLPNDTAENTLLEISNTKRLRLDAVWLDFVNLVQNVTIKVYHKIDASTYRQYDAFTWGTSEEDGVLLSAVTINNDWKITITSTVAQGSVLAIPYNVIKTTMEA